MAKGNTKISYEEGEDILSLWRGKASITSIEIGDFVVDIDSEGYVSGIEIFNASENLGIESRFLSIMDKAKMSVLYKPNYVYIRLDVKLPNKDKEVSIPLTVDLGHKRVEKEQVVFSR
jgi:uncharacterized protein YuzE